MLFKLILLFITVPAVELYTLIYVGSMIGAPVTIAIVVLTGILGAYLAKTQGLMIMQNVRNEIQLGRVPAEDLLHGLLVIVAGAVLITPGFFTDGAGFILLIPYTRKAIFKALRKRIESFIVVRGYSNPPPPPDPIDSESGSDF